MPHVRRPGHRAGLTEIQVREEALAMLDDAGAAGLTMRGLADRLGVQANTLYSYTSSKLSLIDDVLDDVLADVELPDPGDDPAGALHTIMRSTYDVLIAHRRLVPLYVQQQGARGPNAQRLGDFMIQVLERAGITDSLAIEARHVLIVYTIGAAAYHTGGPPAGDATESNDEHHDTRAFLNGLQWLINGIGV